MQPSRPACRSASSAITCAARRTGPVVSDLTSGDFKQSARRVLDEPWFGRWLKEAKQDTLDRLRRAETHEDLLRAQAWHQAVDDLEAAVRRAAKP